MASKKAKKAPKAPKPKVASTTAQTPDAASQQAPIKKKKKNDPLRLQPTWLFPPDEENPVLNPKNKSKEDIQKEIDERLAAIRFLEHKSVTAPVKTAPPVELLQLIGAFFASYGFVSTGRIFSLERNARKKLDGWNDEIGEKKFPKDMPDLVKIFKDWRADWEGDSEAETSNSGEDSESDVDMKDAGSDSDSSGSDSDDESAKEKQAAPKSNGIKIRTKLADSADMKSKKADKKVPATSSSDSKSDSSSSEEEAAAGVALPSSSSESGSDSSVEKVVTNPTPKNITTKAKKNVSAARSSSSSSSESDSESESESDGARATKFLSEMKATPAVAAPIVTKAGSDSSSTFKGNSPTKHLSSSVSSDSSSESESDSSSSDSDTAAATKANSSLKSTKRKAASPIAPETENPSTVDTDNTPQSAKRMKVTNEPFSRIPKDTKVDPRLASNKYISYDYADRAHQDLVVTKGKGFTKEKNKKKRGSYRGGRIDTEGGKAVKFDD